MLSSFVAGFATLRLLGRSYAQPPVVDPPIAIEWDAPRKCPDAPSVRALVDSLLNSSSDAQHRPLGVTFRGTVTEIGSRWQLRVQAGQGSEATWKTLEADTCDLLAEAYALIIASALDPNLAANQARREPVEPTPPASEAKAAESLSSAGMNASVSAASGTRVEVGPLVTGGVGLLPSPAVGVGGAIALDKGLRWEVSGVYWPEQGAEVAGPLPGAAGVRLFVMQPTVCAPLRGRTFALCLGVEVGQMGAAGADVPRPTEGTSLWFATYAGLGVEVPVARAVGLRGRIGIGIPLLRPRFVLENIAGHASLEVFRPAPVFGVLSFEPYLRLFSTEPARAGHGSNR